MSGTSLRSADSDSRLLDAWRGGDDNAGRQLMTRYYGRVSRFFELKAGFVAEDLTQKTFLACLEGADAFRGDASFRAYLFGIARRQYLEHQRRSGRRDHAMSTFGAVDDFPTSMSVRVARREEQQLVLQAMARLPEDLLAALQLYYWENMRTEEIGAVLGVPKSTLTSRLARARELLREEIAQVAHRPALRASILAELDAWARSLASIPLTEPASQWKST